MPEIMVRYDDLRLYCEKRHCGSVPIEYIKQLRTVEGEPPQHGRWILCRERFPEENKVVIVSTTTGYVDFAVLRWGKWFPDGYNGVAFPPNRITAWMPKPDAYEPTKECEEYDNNCRPD